MKHPGGCSPRFAGRYVYATSCIESTYEKIRELTELEEAVSQGAFRSAIGLNAWRDIKSRLGYDREMPISKDWAIRYGRSWYDGKPCFFLRHSRIEYIYTLDV